MSPWVPVAISAFFGLITLAANLLMLGRWAGSTSKAIENLATIVAKLEKRVEEFETEIEGEASLRADFATRMIAAEKVAETFWTLRDQIIAMRAAGEVEQKYSREKLDALGRSIGQIQRQLGNLATGKNGLFTHDTSTGS